MRLPFEKLSAQNVDGFSPRSIPIGERPPAKLGIAAISSQKKPRRAFLVTGSHRRHPAGGLLWGRRPLDQRPLFSERRNTPKIDMGLGRLRR